MRPKAMFSRHPEVGEHQPGTFLTFCSEPAS